MNSFRVPVEGEAVSYFEVGLLGVTLARLAYVVKVHEPKNPATRVNLRVVRVNDGYGRKDVPFGPNSVGCWGWKD